MISTQDIKNKEVINIYDGKSLGFVEDIEVNLEKGTIEGIIVPEPRRFFSFFGRPGEQIIRWRDIKRIGDDVILVDVAGVLDSEFDGYGRSYDQGHGAGYRQETVPSAEPAARQNYENVREMPKEEPRNFDPGESYREQRGGWENFQKPDQGPLLSLSPENRQIDEE